MRPKDCRLFAGSKGSERPSELPIPLSTGETSGSADPRLSAQPTTRVKRRKQRRRQPPRQCCAGEAAWSTQHSASGTSLSPRPPRGRTNPRNTNHRAPGLCLCAHIGRSIDPHTGQHPPPADSRVLEGHPKHFRIECLLHLRRLLDKPRRQAGKDETCGHG